MCNDYLVPIRIDYVSLSQEYGNLDLLLSVEDIVSTHSVTVHRDSFKTVSTLSTWFEQKQFLTHLFLFIVLDFVLFSIHASILGHYEFPI